MQEGEEWDEESIKGQDYRGFGVGNGEDLQLYLDGDWEQVKDFL